MINNTGFGLRIGSVFGVSGINFASIGNLSNVESLSDKVNFNTLNLGGVLGSLIGGILGGLLSQTLSNQISPFSLSASFVASPFNQQPNFNLSFSGVNNHLIMILLINLLMILLQQRKQQSNGFLGSFPKGSLSTIPFGFGSGLGRGLSVGGFPRGVVPSGFTSRDFGMPYLGSLGNISNNRIVQGIGEFGGGQGEYSGVHSIEEFGRGQGEYSVDLIKKFEGFRAHAYWDYQRYSIGYGTKAKSPDEVITREEAERRLREHVERYVLPGIKNLIGQESWNQLSYNQKSALVSFAYNVGVGGATPVLKLVKEGRIEDAAQRMMRHVRAGGKVLQGLVNRRKEEAKLLLS